MMYDHATRAGNRGDVWKHAILTDCIYQLVRNRNGQPFRYAETHAGAGYFTLDDDRHALKVQMMSDEPLAYVYQRLLRRQPARQYWGSWMLVRRIAKNADRPIEMDLWETSPDACRTIRRFNGKSVRLHQSDGFDGILSSTEAWDFIFIDPPYTHPGDWVMAGVLGTRLANEGRPFAIWHPMCDRSRELDVVPGNRAEIDFGRDEYGKRGCTMILGIDCPIPRSIDWSNLRRILRSKKEAV